jgi:hypothetical protein
MSNNVTIQKHAPERRKKAVTTLHCGCCCCCCCCLHTLGSIVCAAVAPAIGSKSPWALTYYYDEEIGQRVPLIRKPGLSAVTFFWWTLAFLTFIGFAIGILSNGRAESLIVTGVIVLLVFPAMQFASVILTMIVYLCWPRPDKRHQLKQLSKITAGVFFGTVLGLGAMVGIGLLFMIGH